MATTSQKIVVTIGGVPTVLDVDANLWGTGTLAQRPGSGDNVGDIYIVQDGGASPPLYRIDVWNGSAWVAATTKGPAGGSTDNAVVRFDGTSGTILNNSVVTIDDSGNMTGVGTLNGTTPGAAVSAMNWRYEASSTAIADPGTDKFRLNNATPGSATAIAFSADSEKIVNLSSVLALIKAGDYMVIMSVTDTADYHVYRFTTNMTNNTTWCTASIVSVSAGGTWTDEELAHFVFFKADTTSFADGTSWSYAGTGTTAMADPGTDRFRLNNATPASATSMAVSAESDKFTDAKELLASLHSGDYIEMVSRSDPADFHIFQVSDTPTDNTTWVQIPVTSVEAGSTWSTGDYVYFKFHRGVQALQSSQLGLPVSVQADVLTRWSAAASNTLQGSTIGLTDDGQMTGLATASFVEHAVGGIESTIDWNVSASQWQLLITNVTYTFTAPPAGSRVMLRLAQDNTGSRTVTWPSTVRWLGGSAPTLATTAGNVDIVTFYFDGYTYWGSHAGAVAWNLVQEFADAHSAHLFWPHNEAAGTTAEDISGNNDDGTYTSMTVNQAGIFKSLLKSVSGTSAYTRVTAITDSPTNAVSVLSAHNLTTKNTVFDMNGTGGRLRLYNVTATLNYYDTQNRSTGRTTASTASRDILEGYTRTSSTNIDLYENGCKWRSLTTGEVTSYTTPDVAHGATYTGTADASTGEYGFLGIFGKRLSEDEHYDIWLRLTGQRHFWHAFIRAEGLTGNCVQYLPLWEVGSSTQLIDLSGNLRHGTATSTPTLGVTPLDRFHVHAVEGAGTAYIATNNTAINILSTTTWTIAGVADSDADGDGLFCFGTTNNIIGLTTIATGNLRLYASDGTATTQTITIPSAGFGWCVRRNGDTLDWWVDGIQQTAISLAGKSFTSNTTHVLMGWGGAHGIGAFAGDFQHRGTFNAALTDAQCSAISHIDLVNQYPVA